MLREKKNDDETGVNPFTHLDKTTVLQETRYFNENNVKPSRCIAILTKLLCLLHQDDRIGNDEATEAFFATTKLFQSKDHSVRQLLYLVIKAMSKICENVIIVTSSLQKDMTGSEEDFKGPAMRALCTITDPSMMQSNERYMKQAIVDKNHSVSCSAMTSAIMLSKTPSGADLVRRWINEIQQAMQSDHFMVQYHALGLMYEVRKVDRLAVTKIAAKRAKMPPRSPHACMQLVRIIARLIDEDPQGHDPELFDFLEHCLRHKSEMVVLEAAKSIINLKNVTTKDLEHAINTLHIYLGSQKPVLKYAAVKALNQISINYPEAITGCNLELENLITDSNRSIATLAITTLLKTGLETSIERLMKQIGLFMNDISDEYKIVVVHSIKSLCTKFPRKHGVLMSFLANVLREDGGFEYKRAVVDAITGIIEEVPESKEAALTQLCECIEDCEHVPLAVRILHLLGEQGPKSVTPGKYIRFIFNRVILEQAVVRAAAVSALAKFGAAVESLRPSILVLLKRCMFDEDDEVRDRATLYFHVLSSGDSTVVSQYVLNPPCVSVVALERAIQQYILTPSEEAFDLRKVPAEEVSIEPKKPSLVVSPSAGDQSSSVIAENKNDTQQRLATICPEFERLGPVIKSCSPVELTDQGTEYAVSCIKHIFASHVLFQFVCNNTVNDQLLTNVTVALDTQDAYQVILVKPIEKLAFEKPMSAWTLVTIPEDPYAIGASFNAVMKFTVCDCDPSTGQPDSEDGYADEYPLEEIDLSVCDFCTRVLKTNWEAAWEEIGPDYQVEETYNLPQLTSIEEAVKKLIEFLGLQPCERSDKVVAGSGKTSHTLLLSGTFRGEDDIVAQAKMLLANGVTMKLSVRATDPDAAQIIASAVA